MKQPKWDKVVKSILKEYGLTQMELAELVGVTQPTIQRLKSGNHSGDLSYRLGSSLMEMYERRYSEDAERSRHGA